MTDDNQLFESVGSKISIPSHRRIKAVCRKLGLSKYELLQMMCDTIIRYMDDAHNLTPEMERAMMIFEHLTGWRDAFNLCDYTSEAEITEAVYFLRDRIKKGSRAVLVERPILTGTDWMQDFNVMHIFERVISNLMPERYMRLRQLAIDNDCTNLLQLIDTLIDEHAKDADIAEVRRGFEDANRSEYGRKPTESPYRRKHHKSPEQMEGITNQLNFDNNEEEEEFTNRD